MNSFEEHALNLKEAQGEQAQGCSRSNSFPPPNPRMAGPTLTFPEYGVTACVSISPLINNFLLANGRSATSFVEKCEFPASDVAAIPPAKFMKGRPCTLKEYPEDPGKQMQLWEGGPLMGGQVYRYMLVDINYKG